MGTAEQIGEGRHNGLLMRRFGDNVSEHLWT
jgi:hypothetical protein